VDWSQELSSKQDIPIPGFNYQFLGSLLKTNVHVKTTIQPTDEKLLLKVSILQNKLVII